MNLNQRRSDHRRLPRLKFGLLSTPPGVKPSMDFECNNPDYQI